jgi:transposase
MDKIDARSLSPDSQVALRKRSVLAVLGGMTQQTVAVALGVRANIVSHWIQTSRNGGESALHARNKGPKKGTGSRLTAIQSTKIRNLIKDKCPDQLQLPF